ncbi:beta-monoglucosyldiacylglycerol synthase [Kordia sp. SMS9]|uniref:glycosyltransferase n=1 Tax=Kordia sp. SMS9 TaxID=2282170 RepID=UPI000E0D919B|nr:glycosyltransferase family 2 protein [Kordia sp. SMS9]AXG70717.1 beta-monoglucosyldiacylglycerol synthase [Kordia sp. SMS9]
MKLFFGIVFTAVILGYALHLLLQAIKQKKIVPLAIFLGILGMYTLSFYNELAFYICWSIFLIPQILFVVYVFIFMIVSITRKKTNTLSDKKIRDEELKFVSIVVAVHNEENVVEDTIHNLLQLDYPKDHYDITFIDDFSKDNTLELLLKYKDQIQVIDRSQNASSTQLKGKPAAINENIDRLKGELICILDADSVIEKGFLQRIVPKFKNPNLGIVQARNIFYNKDKNIVTRLTALDIYSMQHTIYIPVSKLGFGMFEGRAGVFRKKIFKDIQGFDPALPGEDFDFAYRVGLSGYDVHYEDTVFSKEQVTETISEWYKQRKRWLANHVLSCFKNLKGLYKTENLTLSRKIAALFFMLNLAYAFSFNFLGPLMLINEFRYESVLPYVFIISFSLTVVFFCCSYILRTGKLWLLPLIPIMIIYYWTFTVIQTWVLINEKLINIKLSYKKAYHRKPLSNEV